LISQVRDGGALKAADREFECPRCGSVAGYREFFQRRGFFCPHCGTIVCPLLGRKGRMLALSVWLVGAFLICFGFYYDIRWLSLFGVGALFIHVEALSRLRARFLARFESAFVDATVLVSRSAFHQ
jgi:hypothetical protein